MACLMSHKSSLLNKMTGDQERQKTNKKKKETNLTSWKKPHISKWLMTSNYTMVGKNSKVLAANPFMLAHCFFEIVTFLSFSAKAPTICPIFDRLTPRLIPRPLAGFTTPDGIAKISPKPSKIYESYSWLATLVQTRQINQACKWFSAVQKRPFSPKRTAVRRAKCKEQIGFHSRADITLL